jgi:hypothetical protein
MVDEAALLEIIRRITAIERVQGRMSAARLLSPGIGPADFGAVAANNVLAGTGTGVSARKLVAADFSAVAANNVLVGNGTGVTARKVLPADMDPGGVNNRVMRTDGVTVGWAQVLTNDIQGGAIHQAGATYVNSPSTASLGATPTIVPGMTMSLTPVGGGSIWCLMYLIGTNSAAASIIQGVVYINGVSSYWGMYNGPFGANVAAPAIYVGYLSLITGTPNTVDFRWFQTATANITALQGGIALIELKR